MKRILVFVISLAIILIADNALAKTVSVKGYYRKNGTYVRPHTRNVKGSKTSSSKTIRSTKSSVYSTGSSTSSESTSSKATEASGVFSESDETNRRLNFIDDELKLFHIKHKRWPKDLLELYREPNVSIKLRDGWGRKFHYTSTEYGFTLFSVGEDGKAETIDDVKSALSD